jgi:SpoIID/LytB domain protein
MRVSLDHTARILGVLVAATLAVSGLAAGPAGAAASQDSWRVPAQAAITIKGHGYGHGHGMSQYGAEGAAREGLTYEQIADFYYPGTTWGRSRGRVTVLITADATDDLEVRPRPGLTVRDTAGGDRVALPDNGALRWRVAVAPNGATRVAYKLKRWHGYAELEGDGEFYAGGEPVTLVTPSGDRAYRGRLRAVTTPSGHDTVNDVSLESYIKGVVPLEMPATWSTEAVRAQAVAARTYASYERNHPHADHYELCDTTSCQVYGGYDAEHPASNAAVDDTSGRVLLADGAPAFTQFASSSGGWTSAGSVPYLPAKADPYDGWSGNPVHSWSTTIDDATIESAWSAVGNLTRIAVTDRDGNGQWGGRLVSVTLTGSSGKIVVSGDTFRSALGLRSTWVTFRIS